MRNRNQVVLPLNLEICIPKDDPVFKMVEICEQLDYTELYRAYLRSWRKINPETLFELLVFGYMNRKYSARQIEEACRTDIRYMWILQGEPVPDHSTIARFQNEKLSGVIEDLFYQLVEKLHEAGEVGFRNIFVDGTKIEANAKPSADLREPEQLFQDRYRRHLHADEGRSYEKRSVKGRI